MSEELLATLLGFNSGGVVINSMVMELPTRKKSFWDSAWERSGIHFFCY